MSDDKDRKYMMFSKSLQDIDLIEVAPRLKSMGIHSLDLTVRPEGHVEPEQVEEQLPRLFDRLQSVGIGVGMMTTSITDAGDPITGRILRTARKLGIRYYKLGYYHYEGFGSISRQRKEIRRKIAELAELNGEIGIHGGYHNHSHSSVGASLWDVYEVLQDAPESAIGSYLDPAHAVIEGGGAGWLMGMDLLGHRITMLAVKDFYWVDGKQFYGGCRRHSVAMCPLKDGNVPWPEVCKHLVDLGFSGPISFHAEYRGGASFRDMDAMQTIEQTEKDVPLFTKWLDEAEAASGSKEAK